MRYPQVLKYVGKLIYERGLHYYNKDAIKEFITDNRGIHAVVQDSVKNKSYNVDIILDENDEVIKAKCNCPYWSRCKHIAAVLIRYFNNKMGIGTNSTPEDTRQKEKIIPLHFENPPSPPVQHFIDTLTEHLHHTKIDDGRSWELVFKIKKQRSELKNNFYFIISPALQYIKKDGTRGMIYNFSHRKKYHSMGKAENILSMLLNRDENKDDFFGYINDFINDNDLKLFYTNHNRTIPVEMYEITKTTLTFELTEMRMDDVYFTPVITFQGDSKTSSTKTCEHYPVNTGMIFAVLSNNGSFFYIKNNPDYAYFISTIIKKNPFFTPSDIKFMETSLPQSLGNNVDIRFSAKSIKIIDVSPVPVIIIRTLFGGWVDIQITFDYQGNEISYSREDGFVIHNQTGNNIIVIRKNSRAEDTILASISGYLKDYIADNLYGGNPARYQIECSVSFFLKEFGNIFIEKGFRIRIGKDKTVKKRAGGFKFGITTGINWFDLDIYYYDIDGKKYQLAINSEDLHHGIGKIGDSYLLLNKEDCEKVQALLTLCHKEKNTLRFSKLNFIVIETLYNDNATIENKEINYFYSLFTKLKNINTIPEYPLPEHFPACLRNYQKAGYNWLHFLCQTEVNGCLADDMGLGKTIQTLALLEKLKENKELGLCLLVIPVTTFANWESEITRFAPDLRFIRHAGRKRVQNIEDYNDFDIILVSYHTLRNDIEIFSAMVYDFLILDESQSIKNIFSKTFKAVRILKAKHKLSLTGTPVENNTLELWAQMEFLNPGILGSYNDFKKKFTKPIEEYKDNNASEKLKRIVYPFILRRKKEEVIDDLPEKEIIYKYVEMDIIQREAYSEVSRYYKEKLKATIRQKGIRKSSIEIIEALLRLRQMVLFPFLVSSQYAHINSCKFDLLKEMLDEILGEDHKVLIFSQFVQVLKQLEEYIKMNHIPYAYIDGSTKKRSQEIKRFQENRDIPVFLLSLKAGGLGINLTAADYVILFDPWWNPAIEKQAIDRTHRIGQKQKVIAFKIIVKDSIEEKIIQLQNKKENLVNNIVMSEKRIFKSFDENEIMSFFDV
ncbi:MAG: DEAD/DEAH box helicase [Spirochaetales bacterium]|nr:DEAD/DEAH box helicase [Spirochaetales bacterium]